MRTTVVVDDHLLAEAKRRARADGVSLGRIVDDALRERFERDDTSAPGPTIPVFHGTGVRAGIDLTSNRDLFELLDSDQPLDKRR
ncbi:MAG: antitoxin [Actinobacteria bacterium]|nr:antitoxin [Actinomycetota bacterium]